MSFKLISIGLKVVELIMLLAGTGVIGYFFKEYRDASEKRSDNTFAYDTGLFGRYEFYLYTTCIGVVIGIAGLLAAILGAHENKGRALGMVAVHALWALQLLVSAALIAKILSTFEKEQETTTGGITFTSKSACDYWDDGDADYQCSQLIGGVVCGFIAAALFAVDTVVYFISYTRATA